MFYFLTYFEKLAKNWVLLVRTVSSSSDRPLMLREQNQPMVSIPRPTEFAMKCSNAFLLKIFYMGSKITEFKIVLTDCSIISFRSLGARSPNGFPFSNCSASSS